MIDRAGRDDHHIGAAIVAREIRGEPRPVERTHRRAGTENRSPHRLTGKGDLLQPVPDEIVRGILGRTDLLHDHVLLALQLLRIKCRIGEDVGEDIERKRHVGAQNAGIIGGRLGRGGGIEIAPYRFDLLRDLARGAARRALEGHVLEEVRDAVLVGALVAAAGADPDAQRGGLQVRHGVGNHNKARWQTRDFNAHAAAPVSTARLRERMSFSTAAASAGTVVTRSGQ